MNVRKIFSTIAAAVMLLGASANVSAEPKALAFDEGVDWTKKIITVKGAGFAPEGAVSRTQAEGLAFTAAKSDAYRQFGEIIGGVHVEGDRTVATLTATPKIRTRVEATINGAQVVGQDLFSERTRGCAVYMQVPIFGVKNSLAEAVLERPASIEPFPTPDVEAAPSDQLPSGQSPLTRLPSGLQLKSLAAEGDPLTRKSDSKGDSPKDGANSRTTKKSVKDYADKAEGTYTGLIVDCRGLGLQPVMNPVILNTNGTKIYGHKNLDFDKIVSQGMADYAKDSDGVARAGDNPLVVKAVKLENFNSNPVLSLADSNRVLIENHATKFLNDLKVVFLTD